MSEQVKSVLRGNLTDGGHLLHEGHRCFSIAHIMTGAQNLSK